jgi:hypothetical protein
VRAPEHLCRRSTRGRPRPSRAPRQLLFVADTSFCISNCRHGSSRVGR